MLHIAVKGYVATCSLQDFDAKSIFILGTKNNNTVKADFTQQSILW